VAFAHGGNDVGNAVGPLAAIWEVYKTDDTIVDSGQNASSGSGYGSDWNSTNSTGTSLLQEAAKAIKAPDIEFWMLLLGGAGFVVGILLLGVRTIDTVGNKLSALTPSKSFAAQIGAAVAVLTSSALGLPVSTSHCLVGAVIGVGAADRVTGGSSQMNFQILGKIVIGWLVTIPLAMGVAVIIYYMAAEQYTGDE